MAAPELKDKRGKADFKVVPEEHHDSEDHHDDPGMGFMSHGEAKKPEEGEGPWLVSYADMMTLLMGFFALIASFSKPDAQSFEKVQESAVERFGGDYQKPNQALADKIEKVIQEKHLQDQVKVTRAADGVTVKFDGTLFFNSGEFTVKPEGREVISGLLGALSAEIPTHKVLIEGHTDNVPITHNIIASNWELSGIRAARIAQILETHGFKKQQLTIMGWGETKPEVPNFDDKGVAIPENQTKNRRVIFKIHKD